MESSSFFTFVLKKVFGIQAPRPLRARGFTLIEMITVLAIITVITGITLISQTTFNRSIILTDTAYTVALSLRETQSLGLSSKAFGNVSNAGYGVDFNSGTPSSYQQFADVYAPGSVNTAICPNHTVTDPTNPDYKPGDCIYETPVGTNTEDVQKYAFSRGYSATSFCVYKHISGTISGTAYCSVASNNSTNLSTKGATIQLGISTLDILFERPNIDTIMTANYNGVYLGSAGGDFDTACIEITAPGTTYTRYVQVNELGEILVTNACT